MQERERLETKREAAWQAARKKHLEETAEAARLDDEAAVLALHARAYSLTGPTPL